MKQPTLLSMLFTTCSFFAQEIENVDYRLEGKNIVINYDLVNCKSSDKYDITVYFNEQNGTQFNPKTIRGDVKNVEPGENKKIVWDVLEDGISLNGKYSASVFVKNPLVFNDNGNTVETPEPEEEIYTFVDEEAEFPGGYPAMMQLIQKNYVYPPTALDIGVEGKVYVKFVVTSKGKVSSVQVERGLAGCPECDKEAIRVVKLMNGFKPGQVNGKSVSSVFRLPLGLKATNNADERPKIIKRKP